MEKWCWGCEQRTTQILISRKMCTCTCGPPTMQRGALSKCTHLSLPPLLLTFDDFLPDALGQQQQSVLETKTSRSCIELKTLGDGAICRAKCGRANGHVPKWETSYNGGVVREKCFTQKQCREILCYNFFFCRPSTNLITGDKISPLPL